VILTGNGHVFWRFLEDTPNGHPVPREKVMHILLSHGLKAEIAFSLWTLYSLLPRMDIAQSASLFGDIATLLFGAVLFLLSGVAIGYLMSRRRFLPPLAKLETELRRIRNEEIRNQTFGKISEPDPTLYASGIVDDLKEQIEELKQEIQERDRSPSTEQTEEPVIDSIAEWTQKIFELIDPAEIIEPVAVPRELPHDDVEIPKAAQNEPLPPAHAPIASSLSDALINVESVLSLTQDQAIYMAELNMDSFEAISRLSPAGIVRLATLINVPIRDIEEIWIPEAMYRVQISSTPKDNVWAVRETKPLTSEQAQDSYIPDGIEVSG
jgi:hypothetical protein